MEKITLTLNVDDFLLIAEALGELPAKKSFNLISELKQQSAPQFELINKQQKQQQNESKN